MWYNDGVRENGRFCMPYRAVSGKRPILSDRKIGIPDAALCFVCIMKKKCSRCDLMLDKSKFGKCYEGLQGYCKNCKREYGKLYRAKSNKQAIASRRWKKNNPERHRYHSQKWYRENPKKALIKRHRRIAKINDCDGSFTDQEWNDLCAKYHHRCLSCGKKKMLTIDHIIPISEYGSNTINNIQPLCKSCNSIKGIQIIDYR